MKRAAVGLALGVAVACSTNLGVVATLVGGNTCANDGDCARYKQGTVLTCVSGRCSASGNTRGIARLQSPSYPYTLAIAVPDTGSYAAAATLVLPSAKLSLGGPTVPPRNQPCTGDATENTCIVVPQTATSQGFYSTDTVEAGKLGRHINDTNNSSLPVHAQFTLLSSDAQSATTLLSLGVPVLPTFAVVTDQATVPGYPGPGLTPAIVWNAALPEGRYRRDIVVDPPFNDAFPLWTDVITIPSATFSPVLLQSSLSFPTTAIALPSIRTINVTSPAAGAGGVSLRGWQVSIITNDREARLTSNVVTIASPGGGAVQLATVAAPDFPGPTDLTGRAILVAPPTNVIFPSIQYPTTGGVAVDQVYPAVPPPALVSGIVTRSSTNADASSGSPVKATLDFVSVSGSLSPVNANVPLTYRTSVRTADDGSYSVLLPRGSYDVAIEPDSSSGLAVFFASNLGDAGGDQTLQVLDDTLGTNDHAVQPGHGFSVTEPATITGTVTTTDGRPLGGVTVTARPSVGRVAPGVPAELAGLARTRQTTADANGVFTLGVDPGVYDLFAEAPFSSGFAWGVSPAHAIVAAGTTLPVRVDISVPAPIDASMRLYDPNTIPLRGALVQAFAPVNPSDPNSAQIEIGEGRTDSSGGLQLLLPPQLPQ